MQFEQESLGDLFVKAYAAGVPRAALEALILGKPAVAGIPLNDSPNLDGSPPNEESEPRG